MYVIFLKKHLNTVFASCWSTAPTSCLNSQGICRAPSRSQTCLLRRPACTAVPQQTSWELRTATSTCPSTAVSIFHPLLCSSASCCHWLSSVPQPPAVPQECSRGRCSPYPCVWCCWHCWCWCCGSIELGRTGGGAEGGGGEGGRAERKRRTSATTRSNTLRRWWSALLFDPSCIKQRRTIRDSQDASRRGFFFFFKLASAAWEVLLFRQACLCICALHVPSARLAPLNVHSEVSSLNTFCLSL